MSFAGRKQWDELADAILDQDRDGEQHRSTKLSCTTCRGETRLPGEHECADCFIASAQRRACQEQAAPGLDTGWTAA